MPRTFLRGADLVLPSRIVSSGTLVLEDDRIADIADRAVSGGESDRTLDLSGRLIVPGFIDVHVHGVAGMDALDGDGAVAAIAAELPRYGVTAFCPTSVACAPDALTTLLSEVGAVRARANQNGARVLPAHLESNFVNPEYRGAQPLRCLRNVVEPPVARTFRSA
jgi:N-acetylglucosamine-6-phosphate deacetylase